MNRNFFFLCKPILDGSKYHHPLVCLAEGLTQLGKKVYGNEDYWKKTNGNSLIQGDYTLRPDECDVVILDSEWFSNVDRVPKWIFSRRRRYLKIFYDHSDGLFFDPAFHLHPKDLKKLSWINEFDIIFRAHYNLNLQYPSNVEPSAFGLSSRMLRNCASSGNDATRKRNIMVNFRSGHTTRSLFIDKMLPILREKIGIDERIDGFEYDGVSDQDYLDWFQTGKRNNKAYYSRLKNSVACAAMGGYFLSKSHANVLSPFIRYFNKKFNKQCKKSNSIYQFDSWRFWESLASGCLTISADLDKYGCRLPVQPVEGLHYFGVDFDDINGSIERFFELESSWNEIAQNGSAWAIDNYSPLAQARRFLKKIGESV